MARGSKFSVLEAVAAAAGAEVGLLVRFGRLHIEAAAELREGGPDR